MMVKTSSTSDGLTRPRDEQDDDLTTLKLIGPKTQSWLRKSFSVHTFKDLAALSVDQIHSQLQLDGRTVSRTVIGEWIEQAVKIVEASSNADQPSELAKESQNTASERNVEVSAAPGHWKPFASFVVEFQSDDQSRERRTVAHYVEEDKSKIWSGIESDKLCQWVVDSISDELRHEPEGAKRLQPRKEPPVEATTATSPPTSVEFIGVRMIQSPHLETCLYRRGEAHPGFAKGGQPFALRASFDLTGRGAADIAVSGAQYCARFYAHNLSTSLNTHLGNTACDVTNGDQLSYSALLGDVTLALGVYRLDCIAILEGSTVRPGHCRVPMLQVG